MKKLLSALLIIVLAFSVSACSADDKQAENKDNSTSAIETFATNENAQLFFDKIIENKKLIDPIFTAVCSAWKAAEDKTGATVKDVNDAIDVALKKHTESVDTINNSDKSVSELYDHAKRCPASSNVEAVMTAYESYKNAVLKADASTNPGGYADASTAKNSLDKALRNLRSVLDS